MIKMIPAGIAASFIYIPENGNFNAEKQYREKSGQEPEEIFQIQFPYDFRLCQWNNNQTQRKGHIEYNRGDEPVKIRYIFILDV